MTNVAQISSYEITMLALKNDGTVWCWGHGNQGKCGDGDTDDETTPVQTNITDVKAITMGSGHGCAQKNDNTI
jgi:alpha-tubulin suppressor-like RCC1 family protein